MRSPWEPRGFFIAHPQRDPGAEAIRPTRILLVSPPSYYGTSKIRIANRRILLVSLQDDAQNNVANLTFFLLVVWLYAVYLCCSFIIQHG
jgi:hypothetical protein